MARNQSGIGTERKGFLKKKKWAKVEYCKSMAGRV